jgi:hypothetical protein
MVTDPNADPGIVDDRTDITRVHGGRVLRVKAPPTAIPGLMVPFIPW